MRTLEVMKRQHTTKNRITVISKHLPDEETFTKSAMKNTITSTKFAILTL